MRLAILQFDPIWADTERNRLHASNMLKAYNPGDFHFLLLPEMAFSGYVFNTKEEIEPYLEDENAGSTVTWAKKEALRLNCYVQVGYPQKHTVPNETVRYHNSACLVSPLGELVQTYQKHFLYETDENWAEEGPGFLTKEVQLKFNGPEGNANRTTKIGMGICMDVNPYRFLAPFEAFEFANYHRKHGTDLLLCSMAWLNNEETEDKDTPQSSGDVKNHEGEKSDDTTQGILDKINYWALRMLPLFEKEASQNEEEEDGDLAAACPSPGTGGMPGGHTERSGQEAGDRTVGIGSRRNESGTERRKRVIFAASNRTGKERGVRFAGSSCVLELYPGRRPQLLGALGREEEGVLVVEVDDVP